MIPFDVVCTAVTDRADLFCTTMDTLLVHAGETPQLLVVHEDTRANPEIQAANREHEGRIRAWLEAAVAARKATGFIHRVMFPARGMGPAVLWTLEQATTEFVLFTQEDWEVLQPVPVAATLDLMARQGIHHVSFGKRQTMPYKGEGPTRWLKIPVTFCPDGRELFDVADPDQGTVMCVCDHWRTQLGLWRRAVILPTLQEVAPVYPQSNAFAAKFNHAVNMGSADGRLWNDQRFRHERLRTYLWGPVGEPPFIRHAGSDRGTGNIRHHLRQPTPTSSAQP